MIVVRFAKDAIHVEGHANRGHVGPLVCAAASTLMQALSGVMNSRDIDYGRIVVPIRKAHLREAIFVVYALRCMARSWPGNIKVPRTPEWLKHKQARLCRKRRPRR